MTASLTSCGSRDPNTLKTTGILAHPSVISTVCSEWNAWAPGDDETAGGRCLYPSVLRGYSFLSRPIGAGRATKWEGGGSLPRLVQVLGSAGDSHHPPT